MDADHILGILVILGAYGLTWYLLVKSTRIVNTNARRSSEDAGETESGPKPENETGRAM